MADTANSVGTACSDDLLERAERQVRRRSQLTFGVILAGLAYLIVTWFSLDIGGIVSRSEPGRSQALLRDAVAYKTHVLREIRRDNWIVNVEGNTRAAYDEDAYPEWIVREGDMARVDLGDGVVVEMSDERVEFDWPGYGRIVATLDGKTLSVDVPERVLAEEPAYEEKLIARQIASAIESKQRRIDRAFEKSLEDSGWIVATGARFMRWIGNAFRPAPELTAEEIAEIRERFRKNVATHNFSFNGRTLDVRLSWDKRIWIIAGTKIELHRYEYGWENFFFDFNSPLAQMSSAELVDAALSDERIEPELSNATLIWSSFWSNQTWRHSYVANAVFETLMMAFLGTFFASFFGLPLAFLAAKNFTPFRVPLSLGVFTAFAPVRFVSRRFFDFLRGLDMLLWSLIFIRAFGLGPLTGALAIAFTDTGTLGKLFSEALENVDNKQIEGVQATGASQLQRYRYGVIPQIMPVFISQSLYYFESNIRSAAVIGALGAGGIGLILKETINTKNDWEKVLLLIVLTVVLVIIVDLISGWLRRRLIHGGARRASMTGALFAGLAGAAMATLFGLEFLGAAWWIFSLGFTALFIGLALWTIWLIAGTPRGESAFNGAQPAAA